MDIGAFGKGKGKQSIGKHGKGKGKGQQGQHGQDRDKSQDKNKDSVECWNCAKRGHYSKRLLEQEEHQRWIEGKTQTQECRCSQS